MMKRNFWDILAWLSLIYIIVWTLLKMTGVINTPPLLEYSPIFGAVYLGGRALNKLDQLSEDFKEFKEEINNIRKDIHSLDKRVTVLESK